LTIKITKHLPLILIVKGLSVTTRGVKNLARIIEFFLHLFEKENIFEFLW